MKTKIINLVIVTGMSGAGKTVAIQSFEDIGYFTIDNIPPSLVPKVIELLKHSEETDKIALVVDMSPDVTQAAVACVVAGDATYYWTLNYQ